MTRRAPVPTPPDPAKEHAELLRALLVERYRLPPARARDRIAHDESMPAPVRPEPAEPARRSSARGRRPR